MVVAPQSRNYPCRMEGLWLHDYINCSIRDYNIRSLFPCSKGNEIITFLESDNCTTFILRYDLFINKYIYYLSIEMNMYDRRYQCEYAM